MGERLHENWGQIGSKVSMATESSHRVIMEKTVSFIIICIFSRLFFIRSFFILAGNNDMHRRSKESESQSYPTTDCGESKKIPIDL